MKQETYINNNFLNTTEKRKKEFNFLWIKLLNFYLNNS